MKSCVSERQGHADEMLAALQAKMDSSLAALQESHDTATEESREKHDSELEEFRERYARESEESRQTSEKASEEFRANREREIEESREDFETQMEEARGGHERGVEAIQRQNTDTLAAMVAQVLRPLRVSLCFKLSRRFKFWSCDLNSGLRLRDLGVRENHERQFEAIQRQNTETLAAMRSQVLSSLLYYSQA